MASQGGARALALATTSCLAISALLCWAALFAGHQSSGSGGAGLQKRSQALYQNGSGGAGLQKRSQALSQKRARHQAATPVTTSAERHQAATPVTTSADPWRYELRILPLTSSRDTTETTWLLTCNATSSSRRRSWVKANPNPSQPVTGCETSVAGGLAVHASRQSDKFTPWARCANRHATLEAALATCRATQWCDGVTRDNGMA